MDNLITIIKANQDKGAMMPCPRCGKDNMETEMVYNSLSRYADVYICNSCGNEEAFADMGVMQMPLSDWDAFKAFR